MVLLGPELCHGEQEPLLARQQRQRLQRGYTTMAARLHLLWQRGYTYYNGACSVAVSHGGKTTTTAPRHSERRCAAVHEPLAITVCA
jgi:hypothetical protein